MIIKYCYLQTMNLLIEKRKVKDAKNAQATVRTQVHKTVAGI